MTEVASREAWDELRMDPALMQEVEQTYRMDDWADPMTSAVYWAHLGLKYAGKEDAAFLREIIKQSKIIHMKNRNMVK